MVTRSARVCPYCGSDNTHVNDSRAHDEYIYRRRICLDCRKRFSGYEIQAEDYERIKVILQAMEAMNR